MALALDWVALPIVLALAARSLGIGTRYATFVVARNWAAVFAYAPFAVISLLVLTGLIGADAANFLMLVTLLVLLRYTYLIARRTLDAGVGLAVGIVVLDLAVSLTISLGLNGVFEA